MSEFSIEIKGLDELTAAIKRNPQRVIQHTQTFLQRGMAVYRSGIQNNPWRIGESGGGTPVDTSNLLKSHAVRYEQLEASIGPSRNYPVKYASFVHDGTRRMMARPWLDYVKSSSENKIKPLYQDLLNSIVNDLAT